MQIDFATLVPGVFLRRDNRFRVQVRVADRLHIAHLPNSGRLEELLVPEQRVWLSPADLAHNPNRRTAYDLALVELGDRLVSVDARLPSRLVGEALRRHQLVGYEAYASVRSEVRFGSSRLDFRLEDSPGNPDCWIEVKSVTLVEAGSARFPDAPTQRGQRHLQELMRAVENGDRAAVVFVVQREDARDFAPHGDADPEFARILRLAARSGVDVLAWRCRVSRKAIELADMIPVVCDRRRS